MKSSKFVKGYYNKYEHPLSQFTPDEGETYVFQYKSKLNIAFFCVTGNRFRLRLNCKHYSS